MLFPSPHAGMDVPVSSSTDSMSLRHSIYIRTVSSQLTNTTKFLAFLCSGIFVFFLAGLGQKSSVLPTQPMNQFQLDQQSKQRALRAYCPNVYILWSQANVSKMIFLPGQARLVTLTEDNHLHLWEINGTTLQACLCIFISHLSTKVMMVISRRHLLRAQNADNGTFQKEILTSNSKFSMMLLIANCVQSFE